MLTTATHAVQLLHLTICSFCCLNHFTDIHSYLHFETELSRTYKTWRGIAAAVTEFYSIWRMRKLSDTLLYNHLSLVPRDCRRLTSNVAAAVAAMATLQRQPQYCGSNLSSQPVPDSSKQIKVPFMTRRCCNTKTLPLPLHLKKERKEKKSAQFTKIRLPANILSGRWQSIVTAKCRRRIYRARNGKHNT